MANLDFPRGFQPVRYKNNTPMVCDYLDISSSNGTINTNDLLERAADGFIQRATASSRSIVGVAAQHVAANTGGKVAFYPIQGLVMRAQVDDATVDAQTDIGLAYDFVAGSAGTATNSVSQMEIDGSTQASTATLPIKIELVEEMITPAGNALGANVVVLCTINESHYGAGSIGL